MTRKHKWSIRLRPNLTKTWRPHIRYLTLDGCDQTQVSVWDSIGSVTLGAEVNPLITEHSSDGLRGDWKALGFDFQQAISAFEKQSKRKSESAQ